MAVADYPDYDALNLLLGAIGTPSPGSGKTLIDVVNSLASVISQLQIGTPSITAPTLLASAGFGTPLGAGSAASYGPFATTGSSYSMFIAPGSSGAGTIPVFTNSIQITDAASNEVDGISWEVPLSSVNGNNVFVLQGPIAAGNIAVTIVNQDSITRDYIFSLTATQLPLAKHTCETVQFSTIPGYTIPAGLLPAGLILGLESITISAGANAVRLLPPSSGQASISIRAHNATSSGLYQLFPLTQANTYAGTSGAPIWAGSPSGSAELSTVIPLPRCATILKIANTALTAANTFDVALVAIPS